MATLTATRAAATFPVATGFGAGNLRVAWGTYAIAANPTAADIIQLCRIPAGSTVLGGYVMAADIDTGTEALDIDIGWAANGVETADPDGFGNFGVWDGDTVGQIIPVAGSWKPLQGTLLTGGPQSFTNETVIQAVVNVAANAGGTGQITLVVFFVTG
jgi:hypothetical protein